MFGYYKTPTLVSLNFFSDFFNITTIAVTKLRFLICV